MYLMSRAVLKVNENGSVRDRQVLDLSYDEDIKAFHYVYRGTATSTLREYVLEWRERDTRDDT